MDTVPYGSSDGLLYLNHSLHPSITFSFYFLLNSFFGFHILAISATFQIIFSISSLSQVFFTGATSAALITESEPRYNPL